jgi:hypothetical protein
MAAKRGVELSAEMVSQLTILHVCGISPRVYLELLRADGCPLRVIKLGKLRLVRRDELVAWLESLAGAAPPAPADDVQEAPAAQEDPDAIDDLVQGLGFRRAPPLLRVQSRHAAPRSR